MDHKLLDILVCPICKGRLQFNAEKTGLICRAEKLIYPIEDGIPLMLASQAQTYTEPTGNAPGVI
jgi:uncharacterized protein YbaR (Trm112 family)